ncbi:MAG: beta-lactamase family protein [Alphaproteobacteria bacterium]|nr:beta-lactamase family protein [Alphaproteobacteria bacterium]
MGARPEAVGLSSSRLERIDQFVKRKYIDSGRMPCGLVLVHRRGETAHFSAFGMADVERKTPVKDDTIFRIYSMTKPITSIAFMQLVEQGLVALDEPVHKYIPAWKDLGVFVGGFMQTFRTKRPERPMLIIDLLRHTSGLTYGFQESTNVDAAYRKLKIGEIEKSGTLDGMVENLAKLPLEFSPGTAWNYSVSTDIVGYLVEKISGQKFEDYLRAKIFKPLGMIDTDFHVHPGKEARFAACYIPAKGGMELQDDPAKSPYLQPPSFVSGGGGLVSTASDYLRFCRMLLNGGSLDGVQIVSPKTIELMTMNHLPDGKDLPALSRSLFSEVTYNGVGFGLGFSVTMDPAKTMIPGSAGEYSWGGAASTSFWIDPKEELITIFMTQLIPSSTYPIRRELRTMVYSSFTSDRDGGSAKAKVGF